MFSHLKEKKVWDTKGWYNAVQLSNCVLDLVLGRVTLTCVCSGKIYSYELVKT